MKIGTDALVLGSLIEVSNAKHVLDIGTGTGVLPLMLAQRNKSLIIQALEIDVAAYEEACENVANSPFDTPIQVQLGDFLSFQFDHKFDLILSNPPYFEGSTKSTSAERNLARHSDSLPLELLLSGVKSLLTPNGQFWLILPAIVMDQQLVYCQSIALFPRKEILIFGKPSKLARKIVAFSLEDGPLLQRTLTIRDEKGNYSQEYIALTRDFHDRELSKLY